MSIIDEDVRIIIENTLDMHVSNPDMEIHIKNALIEMGIEPTLETVLAFISGTCVRAAIEVYSNKYGRKPSVAEMNPILDLLKRRAWEIRQTYLRARIE